jgi:hypothetical protein
VKYVSVAANDFRLAYVASRELGAAGVTGVGVTGAAGVAAGVATVEVVAAAVVELAAAVGYCAIATRAQARV